MHIREAWLALAASDGYTDDERHPGGKGPENVFPAAARSRKKGRSIAGSALDARRYALRRSYWAMALSSRGENFFA